MHRAGHPHPTSSHHGPQSYHLTRPPLSNCLSVSDIARASAKRNKKKTEKYGAPDARALAFHAVLYKTGWEPEVTKDEVKSLELMERAKQQDAAAAATTLSRVYLEGLFDVKQDTQHAKEKALEAFTEGDPRGTSYRVCVWVNGSMSWWVGGPTFVSRTPFRIPSLPYCFTPVLIRSVIMYFRCPDLSCSTSLTPPRTLLLQRTRRHRSGLPNRAKRRQDIHPLSLPQRTAR